MYNKVVLVGHLTRDVELRYSPSGSAVGTTGIATNRRWKSQMGEMREETMFIDLTFFGRTAEIANQYLRRGIKVLVDGRLTLNEWIGQDGMKRTKHLVTVENLTMLDTKAESEALRGGNYSSSQQSISSPNYGAYSSPQPSQPQPTQPTIQQQPSNTHGTQQIPEIDIDEDEIPF
jgi:single-strand DNA-binding protein